MSPAVLFFAVLTLLTQAPPDRSPAPRVVTRRETMGETFARLLREIPEG